METNRIILSTIANEKGTIGLTLTFYDETETLITPNSASWTLTDSSGTVINSRLNVPVVTLASSITITLSGNDLQITSNITDRIFTIKYSYNSSLGSNLTDYQEASFKIADILTV